MKTIHKLSFLTMLTLSAISCDFEPDLNQDIDTESAFTGVQDVKNGMIGAYYSLGQYGFYGNYAIAIGDFAGGMADGSASSGHMYYLSNYLVTEYDAEIEYVWAYGYQIVDRTVRTINGANELLADANNLHLSNSEKGQLYSYKSQCFGLRALANFTMANIFCYPYSKGRENKGLPIIKDKPVAAFETATRATVGQTYDFILEDIDSALVNYNKAGELAEGSYFYMNQTAIYALKARVNLYMGNYADAEEAAKTAIQIKNKGNGQYTDGLPTDETYVNMWASLGITDEDLFTISKTENDNLSANSLNTIYGSYSCTVSDYCQSFFDETDIRAQLIGVVDGNSPACMKYQGISTSQATSNIPVFRKSEMSLIIAECEARIGSLDEARKYLGYTAKRNTALLGADGLVDLSLLPQTQDELLDFIWEENTREFFGEGHFFYDARRLDKTITVAGGTYTNFKPASFVYPIPGSEIDAGFMTEQNEGWDDGLPSE